MIRPPFLVRLIVFALFAGIGAACAADSGPGGCKKNDIGLFDPDCIATAITEEHEAQAKALAKLSFKPDSKPAEFAAALDALAKTATMIERDRPREDLGSFDPLPPALRTMRYFS